MPEDSHKLDDCIAPLEAGSEVAERVAKLEATSGLSDRIAKLEYNLELEKRVTVLETWIKAIAGFGLASLTALIVLATMLHQALTTIDDINSAKQVAMRDINAVASKSIIEIKPQTEGLAKKVIADQFSQKFPASFAAGFCPPSSKPIATIGILWDGRGSPNGWSKGSPVPGLPEPWSWLNGSLCSSQ